MRSVVQGFTPARRAMLALKGLGVPWGLGATIRKLLATTHC